MRCGPAGESTHTSIPIESWLEGVRRHVMQTAPDLDHVLADYLGEARFGASLIEGDIESLMRGSRILEIGAGMLLLSCALQAGGYRVVALDPIGPGFSHMARLRQIVLEYAAGQACVPDVRTIPAEQLDSEAEFDFAFSINVMEHVHDVAAVLQRVWSALRPGASYRFVCPNYRFPYEPHFDIPTLFSKTLTARVFRSRILGSRTVLDPAGTWASLNWISVALVRRICRRELGVSPEFDRLVCYLFVRRAINDPSFQRRHAPLIRYAFTSLDAVGVTAAFKLLPVGAQPAMSCRLARPR